MEGMNSISFASFRAATEEEVRAAQGNIIYRVLKGPWELLNQILGTIEIFRKGTDVLKWKTTPLQNLSDRVTLLMGCPTPIFTKTLPSIFGNRYFFENEEEIFRAFFEHHRHDSLFKNSQSMMQLYAVIQKVFPEEEFTLDDLMMTCNKSSTKKYRSLLHKILNGRKIQGFLSKIHQNSEEMLENWREQASLGSKINVSYESRLYASKNFTQLLFGKEIASRELAESIDFIGSYMIKSIFKQNSVEDEKNFQNTLGILGKAVEMILQQDSIPIFQDSDLSAAQKKAMIFTLLFAGQETTSSLLSYIIWQLALNPDLQQDLRQEIILSKSEGRFQLPDGIQELFNRSIREFTPALGVARQLKEDVCLEYLVEGEFEVRKKIFYKGEILSLMISRYAKQLPESKVNAYSNWFAFGKGPHQCPGEKLAVEEIKAFLMPLIENFKISTEQIENPTEAQITLKLKDPVLITLSPRQE